MSAKIVGHINWIRPEVAECWKVKFDTPAEAKRVLKHSKRRTGRTESRIYRCPICGKWHTTGQKADGKPSTSKKKRK